MVGSQQQALELECKLLCVETFPKVAFLNCVLRGLRHSPNPFLGNVRQHIPHWPRLIVELGCSRNKNASAGALCPFEVLFK